MMEQFAKVNRLFWNGSPFQWVFYASVLLILIFDKRKVHRLVFGVFPLGMLLVMFNPVTSWAVGDLLRRSDRYYVRLFSIIPVFYCMAYGAVLVLDRAHKTVKLICVCVTAGLVAFAGYSIYREPWMQRAENLNKTPGAVFDVLDAIPREKENVRVAFPNPLYQYARQVDGSITMPYGRRLDGVAIPLLEALSAPVPDATAVMTLAGRDSVDYVVVGASDETKAAFSEGGFEPVAQAAGYLIYPAEGVPRIETVLNEKRQTVSTTSLDAEGHPAFNANSVITTYTYAYDRWGNRTEAAFYDKDGRRVTTVDGYAGWKRRYGLHGLAWLLDSVTYLDTEDKPMLVSGRYETRYRYLRRRDVIEQSYYDLDGQPMLSMDNGYASNVKTTDREGRVVSERFSDTSGQSVLSFDGYAGVDREYDGKRITEERYLDTRDVPIDCVDGFARWSRSYDADGNLAEEAFFDAAGNLVDVRDRLLRQTDADLLLRVRKQSVADSVGIGYTWNEDGSCTVAGEGQGISWNSLLEGDRPSWLLNGQAYRVSYSSENVYLRIYFYEDSTWNSQIGSVIATFGDTEFTVPQNCGAVIVRLWVAPGTSVNETVHPRIYVKQNG